MRDREPVTRTLPAATVREQWEQVLGKVAGGQSRVLIERDGEPVAALISASDLVWFEQLEAQRAERFSILDRIGAAFEDVPLDELEEQVTRALETVRQEKRDLARHRAPTP
jgi:prevent-host-death family protein